MNTITTICLVVYTLLIVLAAGSASMAGNYFKSYGVFALCCAITMIIVVAAYGWALMLVAAAESGI